MAIIKIDQNALNQAQKVDAGWHKFKLVGNQEKANKNKDGVNFFLDFEVLESPVDPRNVGRHHSICVSSKGIGFHFEMFAALLNCSKEEIGLMELDLDKLTGKTAWIEIKDSVNDKGQIQKDAITFTAGNANPPF